MIRKPRESIRKKLSLLTKYCQFFGASFLLEKAAISEYWEACTVPRSRSPKIAIWENYLYTVNMAAILVDSTRQTSSFSVSPLSFHNASLFASSPRAGGACVSISGASPSY